MIAGRCLAQPGTCQLSSPNVSDEVAMCDSERKWMVEYIKVAEQDEIEEGDLFPIEVDGEPICLTRIDGSICAFTDNCTHISGPLHQGELDGHILTCPWHGAQFDVRTGKVLRGPARQDLMTYPIKIEGKAVLLGLPEEEE